MASAYMFSHYFPGDGIGPELNPSFKGYAGWQASTVLPAFVPAFVLAIDVTSISIFVGCIVLYKIVMWLRQPLDSRRVQLRLLWIVWKLLRSEEFAKASSAVRQVAATPRMRESQMWAEIGNRVGAIPGVGENVFRHLLATELYPAPFGRQYRRDLLLDLAYLAMKEKLHRG